MIKMNHTQVWKLLSPVPGVCVRKKGDRNKPRDDGRRGQGDKSSSQEVQAAWGAEGGQGKFFPGVKPTYS